MLKTCPECGSSEIIPDLLLFATAPGRGKQPVFAMMVEPTPVKPPVIWIARDVMVGFRAAVCGECGYTQLYTNHAADLLKAHKVGWKSDTN